MRWDVFAWAAVTLLLFAAEAIAPGAFMLWLGFAAAAVFLGVLVVPGIPLLAQAGAFVVLSFVSIQVYRRWFRGREPQSDRPALNRRTAALVGQVVVLHDPIANGRGRVQIADAACRAAADAHRRGASGAFHSNTVNYIDRVVRE